MRSMKLKLQALLEQLNQHNIKYSLHEGNLRIQAPKGAMNPHLQAEIKALKPLLLASLGGPLPAMDFSLFFFGMESESASASYELLFKAAEFADKHHFKGIWTPERHFHPLGGPFASPSVLAAALAMQTKHLKLRAGSVVLPLRDPIRVAEEWAMVDHLSHGRVEISVATGWHANDFALAPENYHERKAVLQERLSTVEALWNGEKINRLDGTGQSIRVGTYPRPLQKKLPIWQTALGNPESYLQAGRRGHHLLTALLDQDIEELQSKIILYRKARSEAGFDPLKGKVAVFMHAYLGADHLAVKEQVRPAFKAYLAQTLHLLSNLSQALGMAFDPNDFSEQDKDVLLDFAFERYFSSRSLMGTPSDGAVMVAALAAVGVNEIACLLDFGLADAEVLAGLEYLEALKSRCGGSQQRGLTT